MAIYWVVDWENILKPCPARIGMGYVEILESLALGLCGIATILWMSIGTLSRTRGSEIMAQRVIAGMCLISAVMLFALHGYGGELWGSRNIARPFAVIAVIVALASMMNIKGKDVQGEANPHNIMKARKEEE